MRDTKKSSFSRLLRRIHVRATKSILERPASELPHCVEVRPGSSWSYKIKIKQLLLLWKVAFVANRVDQTHRHRALQKEGLLEHHPANNTQVKLQTCRKSKGGICGQVPA